MEEPTEAQIAHLVEIGLTPLKNAMLINSGACIAILTLVGHVLTSQSAKMSAADFATPLLFFGSGVFVTTVGSGTAYFAEGFAILKRDLGAKWWGWATIFLVILSLVLFLAGSYATYNVLNTMPTVAKPAVNVGWVERGDTHQAVVMELQPK